MYSKNIVHNYIRKISIGLEIFFLFFYLNRIMFCKTNKSKLNICCALCICGIHCMEYWKTTNIHNSYYSCKFTLYSSNKVSINGTNLINRNNLLNTSSFVETRSNYMTPIKNFINKNKNYNLNEIFKIYKVDGNIPFGVLK